MHPSRDGGGGVQSEKGRHKECLGGGSDDIDAGCGGKGKQLEKSHRCCRARS